MTRVNLPPVEELMDQHLLAEYRELPMVPAALYRTLVSRKGLDKNRIKEKFTLNTGHVYFFYDKGKFLYKRYKLLVSEMKARNMNPDPNRKFPINIFAANGLFNDYVPDESEIEVSRARILKRVSEKPGYYKKTPYT